MPDGIETVTIRLANCSPAEGNVFAGDLEQSLHAEVGGIELSRVKDDQLTQDFGVTLVAVLGTPALAGLATGLSTWLARRSQAHLKLTRTDQDGAEREIVVDGQIGRRAERVIRDFLDE